MNNNLPEMLNSITLQGLLKNNTLQLKTDKNGRRFISGQLEIDTGTDGEDCIVPIDMFCYELKKDGSKSALFDRTMEVMHYPSAATSTNDNAISVSVTRGRIGDSYFYSDRENRVIENWRLNATFVDQATRNAGRLNNFRLQGVIDSIKDVIDNNGEPTGTLQVDLLVVGYQESILRIPTYALNKEAVNYINKNWEVGDLVEIGGKIEYKTNVVTQETEAAFGEGIQRSFTNTTRRLVITSGSTPKKEDEHSYQRNKLLALNTQKKQVIEEKHNANNARPVSDISQDPYFDF